MASSLVYSSGADGGVGGAQTEACEAWAAAHGPGIARVRGTDRPWPACSRFGADPGGSKVEMWCFRHRGVTLPIYYFTHIRPFLARVARIIVARAESTTVTTMLHRVPGLFPVEVAIFGKIVDWECDAVMTETPHFHLRTARIGPQWATGGPRPVSTTYPRYTGPVGRSPRLAGLGLCPFDAGVCPATVYK